MRIEDGELFGLPDNQNLLFLGSIHKHQVFFVIIIEKEIWNEKTDFIVGAKIACGIKGQELEFNPIDIFALTGDNRENWEIIAKNGELKLRRFCEEVELVLAESIIHIPIEVISSVFKKSFISKNDNHHAHSMY